MSFAGFFRSDEGIAKWDGCGIGENGEDEMFAGGGLTLFADGLKVGVVREGEGARKLHGDCRLRKNRSGLTVPVFEKVWMVRTSRFRVRNYLVLCWTVCRLKWISAPLGRRRLRPLRRRLFKMLRPALVAMRARNPC